MLILALLSQDLQVVLFRTNIVHCNWVAILILNDGLVAALLLALGR